MSRIVKRSILWAILAIIAYWIIGWIVKDIYFSMADIGMDETLEDIWKREMGVYTVVAAIIAGICCLGCADGVENEEILYYLLGISGIAIGAVFLIWLLLPMSTGATILANLLLIAAIVFPVIMWVIKITVNQDDEKEES